MFRSAGYERRFASARLAAALITVSSFLPSFASSASAGLFGAFGPEAFVRSQGRPQAELRSFEVLNPAVPYWIRITNSVDPGGLVSSAVIGLNGEVIVGPKEFNQNVLVIEKPVNLDLVNELAVELRSRPGSAITLEIFGEDTELPTITATAAPVANANGWNNSDVTVSFVCTDPTSGIESCTGPVTVATEGPAQEVVGTAVDLAGNSATTTVVLNIDKSPPTIAPLAIPAPNAAGWNNSPVTVSFSCADTGSGIASCSGPTTVGGEGAGQVVEGLAVDLADNIASANVVLNLDLTAPVLTLTAPADGSVVDDPVVVVEGHASDPHLERVTLNGVIASLSDGSFSEVVPLAVGPNEILVVARDLADNVSAESLSVTRDESGGLPPDPATMAPPLNLTVPTTVFAATEFLYSGDDPIQFDVVPGTIDPRRAAVVRGRVIDREEEAVPGIKVWIHHHPELGYTLTRGDGGFDLAVNGGGHLTVDFGEDELIFLQRPVDVPWGEWVVLEDVVLTPFDSAVNEIDLAAPSEPVQVARGTAQTDADGTRQATLLFEDGVQAELVFSDGSTSPLPTMTLRLTEYTVGPRGDDAMPGPLPPASGYTYAVDLHVEESRASGAETVSFSEAVPFYVENFLGFPAGSTVPVGYYDWSQAAWIASENGRVVEILGVDGGVANLDTTGSGLPATPSEYSELGVSLAERTKLAELYAPGASLWRVPVEHLTPYDCNWPYEPPDDAEDPPEDEDPEEEEDEDEDSDDCKDAGGSIIECRNQVLAESVELAGSSSNLNYRSDRVLGRRAAYTLNLSLSGPSVPASLQKIYILIRVAGRQIALTFPPTPNQSYTFTWDGRDAYGRLVQGHQPVTVHKGFVYEPIYVDPPDFEQVFARWSDSASQIEGSRSRGEIVFWRSWKGLLGGWQAVGQGLGGWSLDNHHAVAAWAGRLHLGTGGTSSFLSDIGIKRFAGIPGFGFSGDGGPALDAQFRSFRALAAGPDGSVYINDLFNYRVRRVTPDGIVDTVVGTGVEGSTGDGGPAVDAQIGQIAGMDVGRDGSLYLADLDANAIRRVGPDGVITAVAGKGFVHSASRPCWTPDVPWPGPEICPALEASVSRPNSVAVAPDGSFYLATANTGAVFHVGTDGMLTTIVGQMGSGYGGDGGPASEARVRVVADLDVGPDGSLYIADERNNRIRRVGPDGVIETVAGTGKRTGCFPFPGCFSGDGGPATEADLNSPGGIAVGSDGSFFIADTSNWRVRLVNSAGIISTFAGSELPFGSCSEIQVEGQLATQGQINTRDEITVGPDNALYFPWCFGIGRLAKPLDIPGVGTAVIQVASKDGREVYQFDVSGRHLRSLSSVSGAVLRTFRYDAVGHLIEEEDAFGNVTRILRDASHQPVAIVGPYGQTTALEVDADGYLASVTNPLGETIQFTYADDGLLATEIDALGNSREFTYDAMGRLARDRDPVGNVHHLERVANGVHYTSRGGFVTEKELLRSATGTNIKRTTNPDGTRTDLSLGFDGNRVLETPSGLVQTTVYETDPRWGLESRATRSTTVETPGGLERVFTQSRSAVLADPDDRFSLVSETTTSTLNGRVFTAELDAVGGELVDTTPAGRQRTRRFDALGRVTERRTAGLVPTRLAFDARGRLERVERGARIARYTYDAEGNVASLVDPLGRTTSFVHDAAGRLVATTAPDGAVSTLTYDANGNVVGVRPPGRPEHRFTYNALDQVAEYTPPDVGIGPTTTVTSYTPDSKLLSIDRPDGRSLGFEYDAAGRLVSLVTPAGPLILGYDPVTGALSSLSSPQGQVNTFDRDGHLVVRESWAGPVNGSVEFVFDENFRRVGRTVNSAHLASFANDADGLPTQAGVMTLERDPANGLLTRTTLGDITTELDYNVYGQRAGFRAKFAGAQIYAASYSYDDLGRLVSKDEDLSGVVTETRYTYDSAGRLAEVRVDGILESSYVYDANGNLLSRTTPATTSVGSYDAQDRLLTYGPNEYAYLRSGELETKTNPAAAETTRYDYDVLGNIRSVRLPDSTLIEYTYDGLSRRVGKQVAGVPVQGFLYRDQLNPAAELDGAGNVISTFVYGARPHVPDYLVRGAATYRMVSDLRGSPRLVIDVVTGAIVQRMDYDELGAVILDTNPGFQPFGFGGGLYDPQTGLVRFGARDYDPEPGRFTAKDPVSFSGGELNLYALGGGDPVNRIDLRGFDSSLLDLINDVYAHELAKDLAGSDNVTTSAELAARFEDALNDLAKQSLACLVLVNIIKDFMGSDSLDSGWGEEIDQQDYDDRFDEDGCPRADAGERIEKRRKQREKNEKECRQALGL